MDFTLIQEIAADVDAVDAALVDAGCLARMAELPKLGSAEVLDQSRDGSVVHQRVRYLFVAELSGAVRRVVDPDQLSWVEESTHDLVAHTASYRIVPDHYANLLSGRYDARAEPGADGTRRTIDGEIRVHVPLLGGRVESAIVSGLRENAAVQAGLLAEWIARPQSGTRPS